MKKAILKEKLFFSLTWDYLNLYLPSQHQGNGATVKAYTDALTVFRRYLTDVLEISIEQFEFKDLTYDFLLDYRIYLEQRGYSPRTINHRLTVITGYMKYAALRRIENYQIYMNVAEVPYVAVPSRMIEIIETEESLAAFLSAPGPSKIGVRDRAILVTLYDTAIRADELLRLDLKSVNLSLDERGPHIRVLGKGDKERAVPVSVHSVPVIQQYIDLYHPGAADRSRPFIYTVIKGKLDRMTERNLERIVAKYGKIVREKYPDFPERVHPHMLRRTRASGWYNEGLPIETISLLLGHSNVETTRRYYARLSLDSLRREMERTGSEADTGTSDVQLPESSVNEDVKPLWKDDAELARLCGVR